MSKIHNISGWRLPSIKERQERLNHLKSDVNKKISIAEFALSISTFDLYSYLKCRFGNPNGFIMELKNRDSSDNLIHWGFELVDGDYYIHIFGMKSHVQIIYAGRVELHDNDWKAFLTELKESFKLYKSDIQKVKNSLEEWNLTFNPYTRIDYRVRYLEHSITHIRSMMDGAETRKDHKKWFSKNSGDLISQFNDFCDACFMLNLLIPLKAESFVNVIFFILARDEVKKDAKVYERIVRTNIDIKITLMHLYCLGFKKKIDPEHEIFKDFMKVYAKRNDSIHGNFRPVQDSYDVVYFDKTIPVFKKQEKPLKSVFSKHLKGNEPDFVLNNLKKVRDFQEWLLECVRDDIKENLLHALKMDELGWDKKREKLGILFPIHEGYISNASCQGIYRDWEDDFYDVFS